MSGPNTSAPLTFREKVWGMIPSVPHPPLPSWQSCKAAIPSWQSCKNAIPSWESCKNAIPSWESCKGTIPTWQACKTAFSSLNPFQSTPKPLVKGTSVDLTRRTTTPTCTSKGSFKVSKGGIVFVVGTTVCFVAYGCLRYLNSKDPRSSATQPSIQDFDVVIANGVSESLSNFVLRLASLAPLAFTAVSRRMMLFAPGYIATVAAGVTATTVVCSVVGQEEVALSQPFINNWDEFPYLSRGRLLVSTPPSNIPSGLNLVQSQMRYLTSISIPNVALMPNAIKDNILYLISTTSYTMQVHIIGQDPLTGLPTTFFAKSVPAGSTGFHSISYLLRKGDKLFATGIRTILQQFDISGSNATSPITIGVPLYSSDPTPFQGNSLAQAGTNPIGVCSNVGFFYVDENSQQVVGSIPSVIGTMLAASEDRYIVGSSSGLTFLSATPSSTPLGTLSISNINSVIYAGNGYCNVATDTNFLIVNVLTMQVENTYNAGVTRKQLLIGNRLYFSNSGTLVGIRDATNVTQPDVSVAASMFPEAGAINTMLPYGNQLILRGTNVNFVTREDQFGFIGTPQPRTNGDYQVPMTATTLDGVQVGGTQMCDIRINPAVSVTPPATNWGFVAAVGQPFYAPLPINTFKHVNGLSMTYTLEAPLGNPVTSVNGISINSVTGELSGTPQAGNVGVTNCYIRATATSTSTNVTPLRLEAAFPPDVTQVDVKQFAIIGEPLKIPLTATSKNPADTFTWTISTDLPTFPTFTNGMLTFNPTSGLSGNYVVTVKATNDRDKTSTEFSFTLFVSEAGYPVWVAPPADKTVSVNNDFDIAIADKAAVNPGDPNGQVVYSATLEDGSELPSWMKFDGKRLYGNTGYFSKFFLDYTYNILLIATRTGAQKTSSTYLYRFTVGGTTLTQVVTTIGGIASGIATFCYGCRARVYNKAIKVRTIPKTSKTFSCVPVMNCVREKIFNKCCCGVCTCCCTCCKTPLPHIKLLQTKEDIYEGQSFECVIKTATKVIAGYKSFLMTPKKKPFPGAANSLPPFIETEPLPNGLTKLKAVWVPKLESGAEKIRIFVTDSVGYNWEKVELTIKRSSTISRPCKPKKSEIHEVKFYLAGSNEPLTEIPDTLHKLRYEVSANKIVANKKFATPITARVFGADKKQPLETIHFNNRPHAKDMQIELDVEANEDSPLIPSANPSAPSELQLTPVKGTGAVVDEKQQNTPSNSSSDDNQD